MTPSAGPQYRGELRRLLRFERNGSTDHDQFTVDVVWAGEDDFGLGDRAQDAADDDFSGFAVFDLSWALQGGRALSHQGCRAVPARQKPGDADLAAGGVPLDGRSCDSCGQAVFGRPY